MTIEQEIQELLAKAEPLRDLPDEESEAAGLPAIVEAINKLRALQGKAEQARDEAEFVAVAESLSPADPVVPAKRAYTRRQKAE